jgi:thiol-disulfide isomerase/thioredoxin
MAAMAAARPALADSASPVARGILANNPLALAFEDAPSRLPGVTLLGLDGKHSITEFRGRTILMPLWAEWCQPCLGELSDFAKLQQKYSNSNFLVLPVLTGARKKLTPQIIGQLFGFLHANALAPMMEDELTSHLMDTMAVRGAQEGAEIPCNLLIAPNGTVVGREFGLKSGNKDDSIAPSPEGASLAARAESGESLSLWGKAEGEQFAAAMAGGFLNEA